MEIVYRTHKNFRVRSVEIVWKSKAFSTCSMVKIDDHWKTTISIPKGVYYYKFFINSLVYLNDPYANHYDFDEDGSLWSVLIVDKIGQRLFNVTQYSIEMKNYFMFNQIIKYSNVNIKEKKLFNKFLDNIISIRCDFANITGIHTLTLLWINPADEVFDISENILSQDDIVNNNVISVWFNLDLKNSRYNYLQGLWKVQLFVNGEFIMDDYFQLGHGAIYTNNGRIIIN